MNELNTSNQKGFTLIEMLVALLLVTIVLTLVAGTSFSTRRNLDEALNNLERGIRFSTDEAALRNTMIRLKMNFDEDPQTWSVEFGPDGSFVLPASQISASKSKSDEDKEKNKQKKIDKKFSRVKEFQEKAKAIASGVKIIGLATSLTKVMILEGQNAIYIYPTGEKDSAIIVIATDDEVASLEIAPFTMEMKRTYYAIDDDSDTDLSERQIEIAEDIYQKWLKN
jgi:prepilin-type N-terminal cleavage/methylation domain-containing protein